MKKNCKVWEKNIWGMVPALNKLHSTSVMKETLIGQKYSIAQLTEKVYAIYSINNQASDLMSSTASIMPLLPTNFWPRTCMLLNRF